MSEPFAFLDEEEDDDDKAGIAWLPLTLAALALAGFLFIPILGLFRTEKRGSDWSNYSQEENLPVERTFADNSAPFTEPVEPLLTPDPVDRQDDLISVDETLSSLGTNYVPPVIDKTDKPKGGFSLSKEQQASATIFSGRAKKSRGDIPALKKVLEVKSVHSKNTTEDSLATAKRIPVVQKPVTSSVAAQVAKPTYEKIVQPGNTLYGISRETGSTPEEIARMNGINPGDPIKEGQRLRVPGEIPAERRRQVAAAAQTYPAPPLKPSSQPIPVRQQPSQIYPISRPPSPPSTVIPERAAQPREANPLDKWKHAIAYRVQSFDNLNRIADAHATTPEELIKLNGRSGVKKGEMLVVPVDNCLIKNSN